MKQVYEACELKYLYIFLSFQANVRLRLVSPWKNGEEVR